MDAKCRNCKNPPEPGRVRCVTCATANRTGTRRLIRDRKQSGLCITCGVSASSGKTRCAEHLKQAVDAAKKYKTLCFNAYGRVCACCLVEFEDTFLTLNHVNNDGSAHRKEIKR